MSRVTRSASASTVSSISRFWSSVNLSHLARRVAVKPLTEVSGDLSSWATVAISSAWLRSVRRRASVSRRATTTRWTGPVGRVRTYCAETRTSRPPGNNRFRSGCRLRMARPPYGSVSCHQRRPSRSSKGRAFSSRCPSASSAGSAVIRAAAALKQITRPCSSATTRPSGSWSGSMPRLGGTTGTGCGHVLGAPRADTHPRTPPLRRRRAPELVTLLVVGDGAAPSGGALCTG